MTWLTFKQNCQISNTQFLLFLVLIELTMKSKQNYMQTYFSEGTLFAWLCSNTELNNIRDACKPNFIKRCIINMLFMVYISTEFQFKKEHQISLNVLICDIPISTTKSNSFSFCSENSRSFSLKQTKIYTSIQKTYSHICFIFIYKYIYFNALIFVNTL